MQDVVRRFLWLINSTFTYMMAQYYKRRQLSTISLDFLYTQVTKTVEPFFLIYFWTLINHIRFLLIDWYNIVFQRKRNLIKNWIQNCLLTYLYYIKIYRQIASEETAYLALIKSRFPIISPDELKKDSSTLWKGVL